MTENWTTIRDRKQAERQALLPAKWLIPQDELPGSEVLNVMELCATRGWLNPSELDITGKTVTRLAADLKAGRLSAVEVVSAFAHRATIAQQLLNALTEINFEQALAIATDQDKHFEVTGQVVGPLHGIPVSIKFLVKGLDTTVGFSAWAGNIAETDAVVVAALRKAGGIILTKTNVGQTLMISESANPVWGRTVNPHNRSLTTGASSGGEGALVGFHGSPLGVGTDIGGSIRVPANFCNLWSLRPSFGRVSLRGVIDTLQGQEAVKTSAGPFAHCPEDLDLFMKAYSAAEPWRSDPVVLDMPWRRNDNQYPERLCFAIAYGSEAITPHPPMMRGLKSVAKALKAAGHIVVEWQGSFRYETTDKLMADFWVADGGEGIKKVLAASGEPVYADIAATFGIEPAPPIHKPSVAELWAMQDKRTKHVEWWSDNWESTASYSGTGRPIDGLIQAVAPGLAWPHRIDVDQKPVWYEHGFCWGEPIFDLASGTFPTGLFQDPDIDLPSKDFVPRSKDDIADQASYNDPEKWRNAPIGLQLTARRLEEEKVVDMLYHIRDALALTK